MTIEATARVAVGTVTFDNSRKQLADLVKSLALASDTLFKALGINVDLYAIDNGTPSGIEDVCRQHGSGGFSFELLEPAGNLGFAASTNALAQRAFSTTSARWFVTVNPDGMLERRCLQELLSIQVADNLCIAEAKQFPEEHPKTYSPETGCTQWASGACLLIPREVFQRLHGFDPNFFMYMEDVDFSWRARSFGISIIHRSEALFAHPVIGRRLNAAGQKRLLKSALYLGQKWKATNFVHWCRLELQKLSLATTDELDAIMTANDARLQLPENSAYAPLNALDFQPDFEHFLSFSQIRWS
jgi:N-acetylglucosaminyl-diphospho-decaprenol L-rhamnosyltransferase